MKPNFFFKKKKLENQNGQLKKYLFVLKYTDCNTLQNYLRKNFSKLTWNDKYNLAFQLAYAVSCLHDEGIVHQDLVINN